MRKSRLSFLLFLFLLLVGCGEVVPDDEAILGEVRSVQHFELTEMELTESFIIRGSGTTIEGIRSLRDRKSTRLNSSHIDRSRMPSSA